MHTKLDTVAKYIEMIKYIHMHDDFSIPEIWAKTGIKHRKTAYRMFDYLSLHFPIYQIRPKIGHKAARYKLLNKEF